MIYYQKAIPALIVLLSNTPWFLGRDIGMVFKTIGYLLFLTNITTTDPFVDLLIMASIVIGSTTGLYSIHYSRLKYRNYDLVPLVDLLALSMIFVYTSNTLIELVTFWLITGIAGFILVAYDYIALQDRHSIRAAIKYLLFSMIPSDIALFLVLTLTGFTEAFELNLKNISPDLSNPIISLLVALGLFAKAAIFPLHFWLPDAHSIAPSPASALLSGLMVKMGIYGLYLVSNYVVNRELLFNIIIFCGAFSLIYAALQAVVQRDIKRILAYSTIANTGLIVLMIALYIYLGEAIYVETAIVFTIAHSIYKAVLFLDSGFIESLVHERNVHRLGYISRIAPLESTMAILAVLIMLGLPPSIGFLAKVFLFLSISKHLGESWIYISLFTLVALKISLSVIYNAHYLRAHIWGAYIKPHEIDHEASVLQPFITILVLSAFIYPFIIVGLNYSIYIELTLLRKVLPALITSTPLVVLVIYYTTDLLKKSSSRRGM